MMRTLSALDTLERSAMDEHYHMVNIIRTSAPLGSVSLLAQLRLERAHFAKIIRLAHTADRQFKLLEKRVRAKIRRRCRALWRLVRMHVLSFRVAWYWFELPSRSSCFEEQRRKAIESFQREWSGCTTSPFADDLREPVHP